jgi:DNA-binding NtrC family response regulator
MGLVPPVLTAAALRALCLHPWRGNVRELSNALERMLIVADGARIDLEHLPPEVRSTDQPSLALKDATDRFERDHIALVLRLHAGNREAAAAALDVSPATLYRRLERLGLKGYEVERSE